MRDPYSIIIQPHITERSVQLSYGDHRVTDEKKLVRKYTFRVATSANKIEIKQAIEAIYNAGKKKKSGDGIEVETVRTINMRGKVKSRNMRPVGKKADWKKAIVTLKAGQMLEDFGV